MTPEQEYARKYYLANKEKYLARSRKWGRENKDKRLNIKLKSLYGITKAEFDAMVFAQGGVCALCHKPPTPRFSRLAVDHDHETGVVRQLLCSKCNKMLGYSMDNADLLRRGAEYIEKHRDMSGRR